MKFLFSVTFGAVWWVVKFCVGSLWSAIVGPYRIMHLDDSIDSLSSASATHGLVDYYKSKN